MCVSSIVCVLKALWRVCVAGGCVLADGFLFTERSKYPVVCARRCVRSALHGTPFCNMETTLGTVDIIHIASIQYVNEHSGSHVTVLPHRHHWNMLIDPQKHTSDIRLELEVLCRQTECAPN